VSDDFSDNESITTHFNADMTFSPIVFYGEQDYLPNLDLFMQKQISQVATEDTVNDFSEISFTTEQREDEKEEKDDKEEKDEKEETSTRQSEASHHISEQLCDITAENSTSIGRLRKRIARGNPCPSKFRSIAKEADTSKENLTNVLTSIFIGDLESLRDCRISLDSEDSLIFDIILHRKLNASFYRSFTLNPCLIEEIRQLHNGESSKRQEEKYKLAFKRALKHLLFRFKQEDMNIELSREDLEDKFFCRYFPDSLPFCIFNPKMVNMKYIKSVIANADLRRCIIKYIKEDFVSDYIREETSQKLTRIIATLHSKAKSHPTKAPTCLKKYVIKNSKFKLPWSKNELEDAKVAVLRLVKRLTIEM